MEPYRRARRDGVLAKWMPSSRDLGCYLIGNLAAFDGALHALRRVTTAADRPNHFLVHSAIATFSANGPL